MQPGLGICATILAAFSTMALGQPQEPAQEPAQAPAQGPAQGQEPAQEPVSTEPEMVSQPLIQPILDDERDAAEELVGPGEHEAGLAAPALAMARPTPRFTSHASYTVCDDEPKPCVRVMGDPGDEFWIIPKDTFQNWGRELAGQYASFERRVEAASSFAYAEWEIENIGEGGYDIPSLGEEGIAYIIVPKCHDAPDRSDAGHFRYRMKGDITLNGSGEKRHRLRCSWE